MAPHPVRHAEHDLPGNSLQPECSAAFPDTHRIPTVFSCFATVKEVTQNKSNENHNDILQYLELTFLCSLCWFLLRSAFFCAAVETVNPAFIVF